MSEQDGNESGIAGAVTAELPQGGTVYFFGVRGRRIKIGHTLNTSMRLRSLRWQFNLPCVPFLAMVPGGREVERAYHDQFAEHRHGKSEWFSPHPEILAEIARLNAQVPA